MILPKLKRVAAVLGITLALLAPAVPVSAAYNPFAEAPCSRANGSAICQRSGGSNNPVIDVLHSVTNIIAVIAGAAAVIVIVYAGIRMITSAGSAEEVARARRSVILALVGIVVIVVARSLISLVLTKIG